MDKPVIRRALPSDADAVIRLLRTIGQLHHDGRPDIYRAGLIKYTHNEFIRKLDMPDDPVFVAELKGEVVGYIFCQTVLRENSEVYVDRRSLYVDDLCVDEHARHMGVATALMNAAVSYAKETGCAGLDLNVWEFNEQALKFYLAYGMKTQRRHMEIVF